MRFLMRDIKRGFGNAGFWAGFGGLGGLFLFSIFSEGYLGAEPDSYFMIVNILAASGFIVFVPVFPVLGYSSSFCEEYESGYYRMILARMGMKKYARTRMISAGLSGGVIVGLPMLLYCLFAGYFGTAEITDVNALRVDADVEMVQIALRYGYAAMAALKVLLCFLFGSLWALVGLAFAVWIPNRYVSLLAPFVLYESLSILMPRPLPPSALVRGDDAGHLFSLLMELVWIAGTALAVMAGFRRRCRDE